MYRALAARRAVISSATWRSPHDRWYWRPQESPDGSRVALVGADFAMDLAVLEGI